MKTIEDIGGFGGRIEARKRLEDCDFIERVRAATYEELIALMKNYSHKSAPRWKIECIRRAMARINDRV